MKKLILFILIITVIELVSRTISQTADPQIRTDLTLQSVNKNNTEQRVYETGREVIRPLYLVIYVGAALVIFFPNLFLSPKQQAEQKTQTTKNKTNQ